MSLSELRNELKNLRGTVKPLSKMKKEEVIRELERSSASHKAVKATLEQEKVPERIIQKVERAEKVVDKKKSLKGPKRMTIAEMKKKLAMLED